MNQRLHLVWDNVRPIPRDDLDPLFAAWADAGIIDLSEYRRLTRPRPELRLITEPSS